MSQSHIDAELVLLWWILDCRIRDALPGFHRGSASRRSIAFKICIQFLSRQSPYPLCLYEPSRMEEAIEAHGLERAHLVQCCLYGNAFCHPVHSHRTQKLHSIPSLLWSPSTGTDLLCRLLLPWRSRECQDCYGHRLSRMLVLLRDAVSVVRLIRVMCPNRNPVRLLYVSR